VSGPPIRGQRVPGGTPKEAYRGLMGAAKGAYPILRRGMFLNVKQQTGP